MNRPANAGVTIEAQIRAQLATAQRLTGLGKNAEALEVLRGMLSLTATGEFWGGVAQQLYRLSDLAGAEQAARKFAAGSKGNPRAKLMLAMILGDEGKTREALPYANKAVKAQPDDAAAQYGLGLLLARDNQLEAALARFRKAVEIDPDHADALEYIAYIGRGEPEQRDIEAVERALENGRHKGEAGEASLWYAMASLHERAGNEENAFAGYEHGASIMHGQRTSDLDAMGRYVDRLKKSFTAEFFERNRKHAYGNKLPIFIVGVPRSGTTLVETALAAHPQVSSAGETPLLQLATLPFRSFEPPDLERIDSAIENVDNPWADMGVALKKSYADRVGRGRRVTEKNLGHHFLLGVAALIARGAPVIYCTRDSAATAWSCFKTRFQSGNYWSYDFDSIVQYQALYADLMQHWQQHRPGAPILEVRYEELVADPGAVIPQLVEHAGLKMHPACLKPQEAKTSVRTASLAQVRQPIHTDAVKGWRRYERWLADRHAVFQTQVSD